MEELSIYSIISILVFTGFWFYNNFKTGISQQINFIDLTVFFGFLTAIVPLIFWLWIKLTNINPTWLLRFEFEEFITGSTLFLLSLLYAIKQLEYEIEPWKLIIILGLGGLTIVFGFSYLFFNKSLLWSFTLISYDILGLVTSGVILYAILGTDRLVFGITILLVAFIFSFAIFFSEPLFLIAVLLYLVGFVIIEYYLISRKHIEDQN